MPDPDLMSPVIENHLVNLLKNLNIDEYTLEVTPGSVKGDNFLGVIASVKVKGKNTNGENSNLDLIVKSAPSGEVLRRYVEMPVAYGREIYMYTKILPEYVHLQTEKRVKEPFASFAKFYNSTLEDHNEALVMENMKVHGFKLWNRYVPVDYNHALLTLRNYAKFHALSFAIKDQKPDVFAEFSANTQERLQTEETVIPDIHEHTQMQVDRALPALDPVKHQEAYDKFKIFPRDALSKVHKVLKSEEAGEYAAIGHGDCWINNMLFKYADAENPTVPTDVCLLDWQLARLGSPALDLSYFIFTCTDKALRDDHYSDLINEYYKTFSTFLRELGSDPEKLFPYEVLQQHLKKFSVYGLYMAIMVLYFLSSDRDEIPDLNSIQDEEDAKQKFSYISKNIDVYRERIRGVILDFIKYDYDF